MRVADLNRSNVAQNYAYIYILFSVAAISCLVVILIYLRNNVYTFPDSLANILLIIVISTGAIYVGNKVIEFNKRDPGNFLKLKQPSMTKPTSVAEDAITAAATAAAAAAEAAKICHGVDCCTIGTGFDSTLVVPRCIITPTCVPGQVVNYERTRCMVPLASTACPSGKIVNTDQNLCVDATSSAFTNMENFQISATSIPPVFKKPLEPFEDIHSTGAVQPRPWVSVNTIAFDFI